MLRFIQKRAETINFNKVTVSVEKVLSAPSTF